ncbi:PilC/PilY family type IV pilus protein [Motilimonas sp. E26]|uniref:pilus assembly protein n=1 Tax=Motilimonas sp. E26 TaxID=2865674 RepID=UPI001E59C968|nr:PilC/PilY family type IV pilus protein [Motilimonas sp. E26]MCE0558651.1 hypothetical protein [Motilimonas sp. E26]
MVKQILIAAALTGVSMAILADDTELYIADVSAQNGLRPQVMIIFDNSGSMRNTELLTKEPFDPTASYGEPNSGKIYWAKAGDGVPSKSDDNYFLVTKNNCQSSIAPLSSAGKYTGNMRRWFAKKRTWRTLSSDKGTWFDCREDVDYKITSNPASGVEGYPRNGSNNPYSSNTSTDIFRGNDGVTLYTEKYLYWHYQNNTIKKSRLAIAQDAISELVKSTPSVNFGLTVFNYNASDGTRNGGRIVRALSNMTELDRASFSNTINAQQAMGNTPLCESLYEVYRYFAGLGVYFGDDDYDYGSYLANKPPRDLKAESPEGTYASPYKTCQDKAYVILMTDGEPTQDGKADSLIYSLTKGNSSYSSYMPALAKYMNNNDINLNKTGKQIISTYTIGFGDGATSGAGGLLLETAKQGGGEYFPATDAADLQQAFQETIIKILDQSSSFNAPAVSATSFDRTQHQNTIYYSMFMPSKKQRWRGNIKKLTIDNKGVLRDASNAAAIDDNGNIREGASTAWGGVNDGNSVTQGGVADAIAAQSSRTLYTNSGNSLITLSLDSIKSHFEASTNLALATELGTDEIGLTRQINWLMGLDVDDIDDDGDTSDYRNDIFADPLHSKPTAITYPSGDNSNTRLLVGTNAGFVHFFYDKGDTVTEEWAFIPDELLDHGLSLIKNIDAPEHPYGMDGSAAVMEITNGAEKQIIAIIGMRRGGRSYYTFDLTTPTSPRLLWKVSNSSAGFEELGQTWSKPQSGFLPIDGKVTPVFVFGAGYDTNQDTCSKSSANDCSDSQGRGVFVVNAQTGKKIWSANISCDSSDPHCMQHSMPAEVTAFDSDDDGYLDRIYSGDTGGNIWRIDMVGEPSNWTHLKLASLSDAGAKGDRRIFNAPTVARTLIQKVVAVDDNYQVFDQAIDMVLVGTGNRAKPASDLSNQDTFVMVKDSYILPTLFGSGKVTKPAPVSFTGLFNITDNPIATSTDLMLSRANLSSHAGWRYDFGNLGEKSLGGALVISGTVYFTSFSPNATANLDCGIDDLGLGKLYAVSLFDGTSQHSWRDKEIGNRVPDTLVVHSGTNQEGKSELRLLGVGQGEQVNVVVGDNPEENAETETVNSGSQTTNATMNPKRIYSFFEEQ